ncbi:hypothetical protein Ddye_020978 [Dipteronia dyeriana]|uniref:Uncharacterized protein n=1 Tax=Dipteronia dyeriana TaxID=168575 RepID=A0AAD9WX32_9ROSI|nr:hypothetical protein Ddye_020978 [Dipteronia dyeriana]
MVGVTNGTYNEIIEKTQKRLAVWKIVSLSLTGRCTLIKSVTSVLPTFAMQYIKLPIKVWHTLDRINKDFLWGSKYDNKKINLVKWDTVCLPKKLGGLGIRKMKLMNQSLLAKTGSRLYQKDYEIWSDLIKANYLKEGSIVIHDNSKARSCSSTWRGLSFGAKLIFEGSHWRVGNGQNVNFWTDVWIPDLGTLWNYAYCNLSDDQINEKVCDYLHASNWNLQKLSYLLCVVVNHIFSLHISNNCDIKDSII